MQEGQRAASFWGEKKSLDFIHFCSSFMQVSLVHWGNCLGAINPCVKIAL